jgi:hypothetical protein
MSDFGSIKTGFFGGGGSGGASCINCVGLTMPSAFCVNNSPLTCSGTICVTACGNAAQYIRGDGTLQNFPEINGGVGGIPYYFNGSVNQGTFGGNTSYQISNIANTGAASNFSLTGNGLIAQFITDSTQPNVTSIPAGNWVFDLYLSNTLASGSPQVYAQIYKYSGSTLTLLSTSPNVTITEGTIVTNYNFEAVVPLTTLLSTDRIVIQVYAANAGSSTTTLYTQNTYLSTVLTTFNAGISSLNGLTCNIQTFAVGTAGTSFNICSLSSTHTFNIPYANATCCGLLLSCDWTNFNNKGSVCSVCAVGCNGITVTGSPITTSGTLTICNTAPYTGQAVEVLASGTCSTYRCCVANIASGNYSASLSGCCNIACGNFATVTGGLCNTASGACSSVNGGFFNVASGVSASVTGGSCNTASGCYSIIGGGLCNNSFTLLGAILGGCKNTICANSTQSTIVGGNSNTIACGSYSKIGSGFSNTICGYYAGIVSGSLNTINACLAFVGSGKSNTISGCYSAIVSGLLNCTFAANSFIGAGQCNCASGIRSTIIAGGNNCVQGLGGFIGVGVCNIICNSTASCCARGSTIVNGVGNNTCGGVWSLPLTCFTTPPTILPTSVFTFIGTGFQNTISGCYSAIVTGYCNNVSGCYSKIGSGCCNSMSGNFSSIISGFSNNISGAFSFIGSGCCNTASNCYSAIIGGYCNTASGAASIASGGFKNNASASCSAIVGGQCNTASGAYGTIVGSGVSCASTLATVIGGQVNCACGQWSTIIGGSGNLICCTSCWSVITGGNDNNLCNACYSTISGGYNNTICGNQSWAMGRQNTVIGGCSGAIGYGLNATASCTLYVNNLCACTNIYDASIASGCAVCATTNGQLIGYTALNCTGTVTCVAAVGSNLTITGSPITTSGTLCICLTGAGVCSALGYSPLNTTCVSGTTNYVSKFTATNSIGNSTITDNGTNVIVGGFCCYGSAITSQTLVTCQLLANNVTIVGVGCANADAGLNYALSTGGANPTYAQVLQLGASGELINFNYNSTRGCWCIGYCTNQNGNFFIPSLTTGCSICVGSSGQLVGYTPPAGCTGTVTSVCVGGSNVNITGTNPITTSGTVCVSIPQSVCTSACPQFAGACLTSTLNGTIDCMSCCVSSPILCGTTCVASPIVCGTNCVITPVSCGSTCVVSPIVCGTTCVITPISCASTCVVSPIVCGTTCVITPIGCASNCIVYNNLLRTTTSLSFTPANYYVGLASCVNCYNQLVTQNLCAGTTASNDIIVNNNCSTDTTYYGDFGMNSSAFTGSGALNAPNMVYLTSTSGDLALGSTTANPIHFVINSGSSDAATIKTTCQLQLPAYSSTSAFTGTAIGYLAYDASGNVLTCGLTPSSEIITLGSGTCSTLRCGVGNGASGNYSSSLSGCYNNAAQPFASIVGGLCNTANGSFTFIGNGICNYITNSASSCCATGAVVVGGIGNNTCGGTFSLATCNFTVAPTICNAGLYSFIGGGFQNIASGCYSIIGGGCSNIASSCYSSVLGGFCNTVTGAYSGAFGCNLTASATCTFYVNNLCSCGIGSFSNSVTASSIIKSGGTSSQFLKADGSIDSNTYLTTSSAASTYVPYSGATGNLAMGTYHITSGSGNIFANDAGAGLAINQNSVTNNLTINFTRSGSGVWAAGTVINGTADDWRLYNYQTSSNGLLINNSTNAVTLYGALTGTTGTFNVGSGLFTINNSYSGGTPSWSSGNDLLLIQGSASTIIQFLPTGTGKTAGIEMSTASTRNVSAFYYDYDNSKWNLTGALSGTSATFTGNVGIGTTSPSATLHVLSTSTTANASAIIENQGSTATSLLYFKNSAARQMLIGYTGASYSGGEYGVIDVLGTYPLKISTNDNVRLTIDGTSGAATFASSVNSSSSALQINPTNGYNVLIGTSTDAGYKLQVNGTASVTQIITDQTWLNSSTFNQTFTISPANGAGTTIISNNSTNYTWTMEPAIGNNRMYILRTIGSNTITINTSGSDVIINNAGSSVSSLTMTLSTGAIILQSDGSSRWIQIK